MTIYILTDYKGFFGSKWNSVPYRSGYDQNILSRLFEQSGYHTEFIPFSEVNLSDRKWRNAIVLYTSSEEPNLLYKQYIEDVILALEIAGARIIPRFSFLRANNNKCFMELLRQNLSSEYHSSIGARQFGCIEELRLAESSGGIMYPCVVKSSEGALSRGVYLARNKSELYAAVGRITHGSTLTSILEYLRVFKHKGYVRDSSNVGKFIIQTFIPNLKNDWKVIIYGDHFYVLKRHTREGDFRASGSGVNYQSGIKAEFPHVLWDFVDKFYRTLDVPNLSIDVGYDGERGYIFEFQAIYFGTSTLIRSNEFYMRSGNNWVSSEKTLNQEEEYVQSIVKFIRERF